MVGDPNLVCCHFTIFSVVESFKAFNVFICYQDCHSKVSAIFGSVNFAKTLSIDQFEIVEDKV